MTSHTKIFSFLFYTTNLTDIISLDIDKFLAVAILLLVAFGVYKKNIFSFFTIFLYMLALSLISMLYGTNESANISLLTSNIRYIVPLTICFALMLKGRIEKKILINILKISLSIVFFSHGLKCIFHNPQFLDYLLISYQLFDLNSLNEDVAKLNLYFIGYIDIIFSLLIFYKKTLIIGLAYMAIWGFLTAFMRNYWLFSYDGVSNFLIRSCHWIIPLAFIVNIKKREENAKVF
tara:strand:+ start:654 stop:1355 length:702 start_codon:yes stop_codon:yes gene_type:complete